MRLEARIKMGYYPTPLSVVERIKAFLEFPDEKTSMFDPCCGDGTALKTLASGNNAETFGIELDEIRAEQAKGNINHVIKSSYEEAKITQCCFSCLFLNPPYDWETKKEGAERKEKTFLQGTIKYLQPKGILIYIIPQTRLDKSIAKILSYRFERFKVFRFPDGEYEAFKQIVLFGEKKAKSGMDENAFNQLIQIPMTDLPEIPYGDKPEYRIPKAKEISLFRSSEIEPAEIEKVAKESSLWKRVKELLFAEHSRLQRPILPLHTGHLGLLLANGCLDGVVGEGSEKHIVKGKVEKEIVKHTEYKGDIVEEKETDTYKVTIKLLKQDGEILIVI